MQPPDPLWIPPGLTLAWLSLCAIFYNQHLLKPGRDIKKSEPKPGHLKPVTQWLLPLEKNAYKVSEMQCKNGDVEKWPQQAKAEGAKANENISGRREA